MDGANDPDARAQNVVVANNTADNAAFGVSPGSEGVIFSGNTVTGDLPVAYNASATDPASPNYAARTLRDITFEGNAYNSTSQWTRCFGITGTVPTGQIALTGNTFTAPKFETGANQSAAVYVEAADLSGFSAISGNQWQKPVATVWVKDAVFYVFPKWSDPSGYLTAAQWAALPQVKSDIVR